VEYQNIIKTQKKINLKLKKLIISLKKPLDLNAKGLKNIILAILKNSDNKFIK